MRVLTNKSKAATNGSLGEFGWDITTNDCYELKDMKLHRSDLQ